jgi:protein-disulfide isomerase
MTPVAGGPVSKGPVRGRLWAVVLVLGFTTAAAAQPAALPLAVSAAVPDLRADTLTITGEGFGQNPFVTLDLVPLQIQAANDTRIVAAVPVSMMPPGDYLLTVSRGPAAGESASIQVKVGPIEAARGQSGGQERGGGSPAGAAGAAVSRGTPSASPPTAARSPFSGPAAEPAAKVGDRVITVAEVDREWQRTDPSSYIQAGRLVHDRRREAADRLVADELIAREAAARGVTADALLAEEVPKRIVPMPESAVVSLFQGLGETTRGVTLEQMRPALRAWLQRVTEPEMAKMNYLEELMRVSTRAELFLAPPRVEVEQSAQDAVLGSATAPVEIVAFGDFLQPEYARFAQAFGRVRDTYGNRVRVVFKHLPSGVPESFMAAEAALCANGQGKFWPYHDALLSKPGVVDAARLTQTAAAAGLDPAAYANCVERGEARGVLRQAMDEAARYDLQVSPSFLVNGRLVPEPPTFLPPFEFFTRVIEEELLRQSREAAAGR